MKRLPDHIKRRVVEHLACFRSHAEVSDLIREEFGVEVPPRHVRSYDPTSFQFAGAPKWREYHTLARKRFEREIAEVPISHRAWRLRRMTEDYYRVRDTDLETARKILEQAAKEVGNVYTNIAKVQGTAAHTMLNRTPDESRHLLADRLNDAMARLLKQ